MGHEKQRNPGYSYADGKRFVNQSPEEIFAEISENNFWLGSESISGIGSSLDQTMEVIARLPGIIKKLDIKTMLDLPCGDLNWMKRIDLKDIQYTGGDIVKSIIEKNRKQYDAENISFLHINLMEAQLGSYDLIFNRDCLVHFSFRDIWKSLYNILKSGSRFLITTTFTSQPTNTDIPTGGWRPLNLEMGPFNFPKPVILLNEKCTEQGGNFRDKSLGVWKIKNLKNQRLR